jgi:hypothetical protein
MYIFLWRCLWSCARGHALVISYSIRLLGYRAPSYIGACGGHFISKCTIRVSTAATDTLTRFSRVCCALSVTCESSSFATTASALTSATQIACLSSSSDSTQPRKYPGTGMGALLCASRSSIATEGVSGSAAHLTKGLCSILRCQASTPLLHATAILTS